MKYSLNLALSNTFLSIFILFLTLSISVTHAQKVLLIEKVNSAKTLKYQIGDILIFKLGKTGHWFRERINNIDIENNIIEFETLLVHKSEIVAIKTSFHRLFTIFSTSKFLGYGIPMLAYTLIDGLVYGAFSPFGYITGSVAVIAGVTSYMAGRYLMKKSIGSKYRIRLLDLSF